ncbi:MAG: DUF190 domain-containing protein [Chloroflexi bacterium]|nr:DUF190 domain-containing protein [Chloroflexota bacterium]
MATASNVQRVRIYLRRDDQWQGGVRYLALLEALRRRGATGATALQGLAGFGPGQRASPTLVEPPEPQRPVVIEWIDRAERVARLLPMLDDLIGDALVTVEEVPVYRALLRAPGPFAADRSAGDVMRRPAPSVTPDTPLALAATTMGSEGLTALPVCDAGDRLIGMLTSQDLAFRAGLRLPLPLLALLGPAEREAVLAPLAGRPTSSVMRSELHSVSAGTTIPQAIVTLVEWGYSHVPVTDRDGRLVGLIGQHEILHAAVAQADADAAGAGAVRDADRPTSAALVMQAASVTLPADAPLATALVQLLAAPEQTVLVLAGERIVGTLDAAAALHGLQGAERAAFLAALNEPRPPRADLPGAGRPLSELQQPGPPEIAPDASLIAVARHLLDARIDRIAVVDAERKLLGIIGRGALIRALLQQTE